MLLQLCLIGAVLGAFYALIGVGYTVIYGTVRLINFAHGDMYMLGAFFGFTILSSLSAPTTLALSILASIAGTIIATAFAGFAVRWVLERVDAKHSSFSPIIAAIGISIVIQNSALHLWGSRPVAYPVQMAQNFAKPLITLLVCVALILIVDVWVSRSKFGAAMRAVGSDHVAVRLMGIRGAIGFDPPFGVF